MSCLFFLLFVFDFNGFFLIVCATFCKMKFWFCFVYGFQSKLWKHLYILSINQWLWTNFELSQMETPINWKRHHAHQKKKRQRIQYWLMVIMTFESERINVYKLYKLFIATRRPHKKWNWNRMVFCFCFVSFLFSSHICVRNGFYLFPMNNMFKFDNIREFRVKSCVGFIEFTKKKKTSVGKPKYVCNAKVIIVLMLLTLDCALVCYHKTKLK